MIPAADGWATAGGLPAVAALSYLAGSVPFGLVLTRLAGLGDLRAIGSGNIGATNVLRTGRRGLAAATLLLDGAKGLLAVAGAEAACGPWGGAVAAVCVVLGHCFPAWLRFRGGKGVATGLGAMLGLDWRVGRRGLRGLARGGGAEPDLLGRRAGVDGGGRARGRRADGVAGLRRGGAGRGAGRGAAPRQHRAAGGGHRAEDRGEGVSEGGQGQGPCPWTPPRARPWNPRPRVQGFQRAPPFGGFGQSPTLLPSRRAAVSDLDRLRLARTEGVGPVTYRRLLARFATAAEAIDALPGLARSGGRSEPPRVPGRDEAARELDRLARLGGRMLFLGAPDYPPLLALLADAPSAIAVLGDVGCLSARAVGLVGARNCSTNGERMAEALSTDLASSGLVVVSGLARGIDAAAHRGAMHVGRTIACVAGGLDRPYPSDHAALQAEVAAHGAVVAESALGVEPQNRHFPRRNRIIAGLSLGVVVVEAALRSGTLITARLAQELHREIFAVPGSPLDPRSRGSNDLIRQGAWLTEQASDVLANLPDHGPALGGAHAAADAGEPDGGAMAADPAAADGAAAAGPRAGTGPDAAPLPLNVGAPATEPGAAGSPARPRRGAGLLRRAGRPGADGTAAGPGPDGRADGARGGTDGPGAVQAEVLACLDSSPTPVDEVVRRCHLSASAVSSALLELELAGRIETLPGNRVCLLIDTGP